MGLLKIKNMEKEVFKMTLEECLNNIQAIIKTAEKRCLINTQEFINFLDELNELSIKY